MPTGHEKGDMKKLVIMLASLTLAGVCTVWAIDNFATGYPFDGASGLKSGADLEDLVTQARFSADATHVNNTNRIFNEDVFTNCTHGSVSNLITIKNGGVTAEMMAATAFTNAWDKGFPWQPLGLTNVTLSAGNIIATNNWTSPISNWTNAFDGVVGSHSTTGTIASGVTATFMYDLGTNMCGWYRLTFSSQATSASGDFCGGNLMSCGYYPHPLFVAGTWQAGQILTSGIQSHGAKAVTNVIYAPFEGRYIGAEFYKGNYGGVGSFCIFEMEVMGRVR